MQTIRKPRLLLVEGRDEVNLFKALISDCFDDYLNCLEERHATGSGSADKSWAHAYLAAAEDPVARVGEGALQGVWDFAAPAFAPLAGFLHQLTLRAGGGSQVSR